MDKQIIINIAEQSLQLINDGQVINSYPVSTARNGPGELMDSECTPRGEHIITEKIGEGADVNAVFVGRKTTGELYHPELRKLNPGRDWILTRILWLKGTVQGLNLGGNVDSYHRYIYIHGSPEDVEMGKPGSRGCIRMRNEDVIDLFEQVETGVKVSIIEN